MNRGRKRKACKVHVIFYICRYMKTPDLKYLIFLLATLFFSSCAQKEKTKVDLILMNARVYTVDSNFSMAEAIAISDGQVVAAGKWKEIKSGYETENVVDLDGATVYPGLFDAHCHFYGYGVNQSELDLRDAGSFDDMINKVIAYAQENPDGWLVARGWNEEEWVEKTRMNNLKLSILFPERPVVLRRVDGHAALVNQAALDVAGINNYTLIDGGGIEIFNDRLTGMLVDKAVDRVLAFRPGRTRQEKVKALLKAQEDCLEYGLTTVADAGLDLDVIRLIDSLQKSGDLKIRIYAMANPGEKELTFFKENGPIISNRLIVRSFKLYVDGALGSRGALLLQPYCDDTSAIGLLQNSPAYLDELCGRIFDMQMQVNSHCIGDSANRLMLSIYRKYNLEGSKLRWRIEHAQVVHPNDWHHFGELGIIPSVQPTHLISDMAMARKRLCTDQRLRGAYAYKSLDKAAGHIAFGTDFPVEGISPVATFQAAVFRKRPDGSTLHPDEKFSAKRALEAMTIESAYSCFMDDKLGSIEVGKRADLTIFREDLLTARAQAKIRVMATIIDGEIVYIQ